MKNHHRIYSFDYYAYRSPVKMWNPCLKLSAVFLLLCLCISGNSLAASLYLILSMTILNVKLNKIAVREYIELLCIPLVFIILGSSAIALEIGIGEGIGFPRIWITGNSLYRSLRVGLRAFGAVSILYFLTLSTPVDEIVTVLRKCRLPQLITELMSLIYRYIFIMADTEQRIRSAAASRLGYRDFKTSLRTFGSSLGNLFAISLKRAGSYYDAMEARCYDGELLFLEDKKPVHFKQILLLILYVISILTVQIFAGRGMGL